MNKKLRLDNRANSENWHARLTLADGKRVVLSIKTDDLEQAQERALKLYCETQARIANRLPAQTRMFKHVAEHAIINLFARFYALAGIKGASAHSGRRQFSLSLLTRESAPA